MACRPQPYRLDPPATPETLPQIVTNADEMFQILFEDLQELCAAVDALAASQGSTVVQSGQQLTFSFGDSVEGEPGPMGPPGQQGATGPQGPPGVQGFNGSDGEDNGAVWAFAGAAAGAASATDHQWSVLTNGDVASPELIFADGDVIMLEI